MPRPPRRGLRRAAQSTYLQLRHSRVLRILRELERSQWLPAGEISAIRDRRLSALLSHAGARVPYYREAFRRARADPAAGAAALAALPVLTKEIIRSAGGSLLSDDAHSRHSFRNTTGGSTGVPLRFVQDAAYEAHRRAAMYRGFGWCGWPLGGRLAYVWGDDPDRGSREWRGRLLDRIFGNVRIDAFTLEERNMDGVLDDLGASQPDLLVGYASSLRLLARRALSRGGGPALPAVESSAEMLDPGARREIEEAFRCHVFDRYGCREAGVIAHECGAGSGWHVNAESVHLETEPDGSLLVTTLMNWSMPLIRYRNEDLVEMDVQESCPCGRGLPLLKRVMGRRSDVILSPSGRAIHGEFFTHLFYDTRAVRAFQVVQTGTRSLVIRVVADESFGEDARAGITRAIHERGDQGFEVRWEIVPRIPAGPSGKHRFTLREIPGEERRGSA